MSCFYRRTSKYHNTLQNDETGRTPLHNACINHAALSVIQQILNTDNYIRAKDSFGETPLHYACQFGASFSIVSLLLETCPEAVKDVGRYGWTPLHVAIRNKTASLEVIQLLMEKWPEAMRVEDENGCCPLHLACRNRASVDVVRLLVERCEEGVCRENHNGTLLHHACSKKAPSEVVALLLQKYPQAVKQKDNFGETPLHVACRNKAPIEVLSLLLEHWPQAVQQPSLMDITPHDIILQRKNIPPSIVWLITSVYYLFDSGEVEIPTAKGAMDCFISIEWSFGIRLVLDLCPSVTQVMEMNDLYMPYFLGMVGRRCKMLTLWNMLLNMQDLLNTAQ